MKNASLRVGVVGCGAGGAATAVFLARAGHEVVVFEQAEECRAVGAGFLLQPTGQAVLRELGVAEEVLGHASRVSRLRVVERGRGEMFALEYGELGEGLYGAGLHRDVLMRSLIGLVQKAGVEIRWGRRVEGASRERDGWRVDGEFFDLLVVADGARSAMRRALLGEGYDRGYPWGAFWFIGEGKGAFAEDELYQVVEGTRRMAGFLPTGRRWGEGRGGAGRDLVSLFWSVPLRAEAEMRAGSLAKWKEEVRAFCPRAEGFLGQIGSWDELLTARYGDVRLGAWHRESLVFIGDAGHAMSPQLGQGVNLALADAACLAGCLADADGGVAEALACYSRRRRWVLWYYQLATGGLTPWFQSDADWLTCWRRWGFRGMVRVGP
ncbi:MAG: FAD-dependent oxidoreductase, partial [Verrucomicrobiales bacterium]